MGKPKKGKKNNSGSVKVSLEDQLTNGGGVNKSKKNKFKLKFRAEEEDFVDAKTSEKILSIARKQQAELFTDDAQFGPSLSSSFNKHRGGGGGGAGAGGAAGKQTLNNTNYRIKNKKFGSNDSDSDADDFDDVNGSTGNDINPDDFFDDIKLSKEDEQAIALFRNNDGRKTRKLADVILEKIAEKETELQEQLTEVNSLEMEELDPRVREMYEGVRDVMKRYRSGKVPKAFKLIPKLRNWEQILFVTEPHNWSAAAMYQGARIFASVLTQNMAQRFFNLVLLPRIRDDLAEYKRLNPHLYNALKKALFKPAAFMKGIILPLLESGDCTLREAIIFGSIIARHQIPILHSSACLLKICEMEYSGANSIFIRIFLDKRYALPYRVVDGAVYHFLRFEHDKREMPVLWHQSFLTFVQRYKNDISSEQKDALNEVLKKQYHPKITPDIRRELQAGRCRDECAPLPDDSFKDFYTDEVPMVDPQNHPWGHINTIDDIEM